MAFAEGDQAVQTFLFDRPDEPFREGVGILRAIRCLDDTNPCVMQARPGRLTPFRIPVDCVEGDQAAPGPHFGREEICRGDPTQVRPQERLPRGGTFRDGRNPVCSQDPGNRGPAHAVPEVLERTLDARVAPPRILLRHPPNQLADLRHNTATRLALLGVGPFAGDELPMPASNVSGVTIVASSRNI